MFRHKPGEPIRKTLESVWQAFDTKLGLNPWQWLKAQREEIAAQANPKLKRAA
jgi:hypothetical protein